ncbi:MAG: hypothetical protein JWM44_699 [Bacilli bacterium]|nr:hypothetical protein [Bacilli bacterium]
MAKVKTSISIDEEAFEYISKLAEKEVRSVSQQINKLILDLMKKEQ